MAADLDPSQFPRIGACAAFKAHRSALHNVASEKFDAGKIDDNLDYPVISLRI
jgi:hypothetical protein